MKYLGVILFYSAAAFGCQPVTGDHITAKDLAVVAPVFAQLPPEAPVAFAPSPGVERVFTPGQLYRLAARLGLPAMSFGEVCFEVPTHILTIGEVLDGIKPMLPPGFSVEVIEVSNYRVPSGVVQFALPALGPGGTYNNETMLWRGRMQFQGRATDIWARVRIVPQARPVVIVTQDAGFVPAPKALAAAASSDATPKRPGSRGLPLASRVLTTTANAFAGGLEQLSNGFHVMATKVENRYVIRTGDNVEVTTTCGNVTLKNTSIARESGKVGSFILFKSGNNGEFHARVDGPGRASIHLDGGQQ